MKLFKTKKYQKYINDIAYEYYRTHGVRKSQPSREESEPDRDFICFSLDVPDKTKESGTLLDSKELQKLTDEFELSYVKNRSFQEFLFYLLNKGKLDDVAFYRAAGFDRRLFSTIRSNKDYRPSRDTALACCVALGLLDDELEALLLSAGYALSEDKRDQAIYFCIEKGIRKVAVVNDVLYALEVKPIGR